MKRVIINGTAYKTRFGFVAEADFQTETEKTYLDMLIMFTNAAKGNALNVHKLDIKSTMQLFAVGLRHGKNEKQFADWQALADELDTDKTAISQLIDNFIYDITGQESPNEESPTKKSGKNVHQLAPSTD